MCVLWMSEDHQKLYHIGGSGLIRQQLRVSSGPTQPAPAAGTVGFTLPEEHEG